MEGSELPMDIAEAWYYLCQWVQQLGLSWECQSSGYGLSVLNQNHFLLRHRCVNNRTRPFIRGIEFKKKTRCSLPQVCPALL